MANREQQDLAQRFMRAGESQEQRARRAFSSTLEEIFGGMASGMTVPFSPSTSGDDKVVITCASCLQGNRVPLSRIREARCGACKRPLAT